MPQHVLEIRYGPGPAVSDFELEGLYQYTLVKLQSGNVSLVCSTSNLFHRVRVGIKRGELESGKVRFLYEDWVLVPDKNGRIEGWPDGFADRVDELMEELL